MSFGVFLVILGRDVGRGLTTVLPFATKSQIIPQHFKWATSDFTVDWGQFVANKGLSILVNLPENMLCFSFFFDDILITCHNQIQQEKNTLREFLLGGRPLFQQHIKDPDSFLEQLLPIFCNYESPLQFH